MSNVIGTRGASVLSKFAVLDLGDEDALGARTVWARRRAGRRDRDAQEGLAALGRIHDEDEDPHDGPVDREHVLLDIDVDAIGEDRSSSDRAA